METERLPAWTGAKPIQEQRDRTQSQILVLVVGLLLAGPTLLCIDLALVTGTDGRIGCRVALAVSIGFGLLVWLLRAATLPAALAGSMVCLLVTVFTEGSGQSLLRSMLPSLVALFLLTFAATRIAREKGVKTEIREARHGRRLNQVIANLGWAGLNLYLQLLPTTLGPDGAWSLLLVEVVLLAVLAESTADTVSSEIGQAFGGTPFLLGSWRRVDAGTDGGVTTAGTLAGIAGALIVVMVGVATLDLSWKAASVALVAAVAGLFFDSFLGATFERRGWLGNDLVNFISNGFAALIAGILLWLLA